MRLTFEEMQERNAYLMNLSKSGETLLVLLDISGVPNRMAPFGSKWPTKPMLAVTDKYLKINRTFSFTDWENEVFGYELMEWADNWDFEIYNPPSL